MFDSHNDYFTEERIDHYRPGVLAPLQHCPAMRVVRKISFSRSEIHVPAPHYQMALVVIVVIVVIIIIKLG